MGLVLCNNYPVSIWTAIMFYSPETCGGEGGNFEKMGWWPIAPGACALVYANDLADVNKFWYYYAEADDGAVWAGPFRTQVSLAAFGGGRWCWGLGTTAPGQVVIAYRELDIGDNDDYTLTFVP
jgi:uncharacterized membrane protein